MENFGLLLHDAARLLRKRFEARGQDLGLSSAQWRLLVRLVREGQATQARLADLMEIEPISVSRLVDRMELAGWVARKPHPTDRRTNIVVPTEKAVQARATIKDMAQDIYAEATAGMTDADRRLLVALLTKVGENLSPIDELETAAGRHSEDVK